MSIKKITKKSNVAIDRRFKHLAKCTKEVIHAELGYSAENSSNCLHCATAWAANRMMAIEVQEEMKRIEEIRKILKI